MSIEDAQEFIIGIDGDGVIHKSKRVTDKQLKYLSYLEHQLGYQPRNHDQLTVWRAKAMIDRYAKRLETKNQIELF